ncbi:hypothetical protein HK096_006725, partial [Nowakowskiella sp. JEL0078]
MYQFMGKDNVRFHTIIYPSSQFGTHDNWTMLHHLSTTEYLQYEGKKFSKSNGVGVFGDNVMESGIPAEVYRFYLIDQRPETGDTQFFWKDLIAANNNILLANFGNFVNRVMKFVSSKYSSIIPEYSILEEPESVLISNVNVQLKQYCELLEEVKIRAALKVVLEISALGNTYLQDNRIDNSLFTNQRSRCDNVVSIAINLAYLLGSLVYPFMPTTAETTWRQLNVWPRSIPDIWNANDILPGHSVSTPEYLFVRIDPARAEELSAKYNGQKGLATAPILLKPKLTKQPKGTAPNSEKKQETPAKTEKNSVDSLLEMHTTTEKKKENHKIEKVTEFSVPDSPIIETLKKEAKPEEPILEGIPAIE